LNLLTYLLTRLIDEALCVDTFPVLTSVVTLLILMTPQVRFLRARGERKMRLRQVAVNKWYMASDIIERWKASAQRQLCLPL